jgi:hypothetical protein
MRPGFSRFGPVLCVASVVLSAAGAHAQEATELPRRDPWLVSVSHWGRWPALAAAAGFITAAALRSGDSKEALGTLEDYCREDFSRCVVVEGPDGSGPSYADPVAEELYEEYATRSRQARGYLLGGQASLLVAGAMFLIDLVHDPGDIDNIPYTPFELYSTPRKLGLALRF